ncbi:hypothetical protein ACXZ9C_11260 [Streptococcus agalactiae]
MVRSSLVAWSSWRRRGVAWLSVAWRRVAWRARGVASRRRGGRVAWAWRRVASASRVVGCVVSRRVSWLAVASRRVVASWVSACVASSVVVVVVACECRSSS